MFPLGIFKTVTTLLVSTGAGAIVGNAVKATTPAEINTLNKVTIAAGSFALSGLVGAAASKYTAKQIDDTVTQIQALKQARQK